MDFEDILEEIGSFGHWQRVIFCLICVADVFGAFAMVVPVFVGATPKWSCLEFVSGDLQQNGTILDPAIWMNNSRGMCNFNKTYRCSNISFHDEFTSIVSEWSLVCDRDYISDLILTVQMVGLAFGAGIFAQLSGTIGRKKCYFITFSVTIGAGLISAVSPMWQIYAACRFFVGLGYGGLYVVNSVYPLEFVGREWRSVSGTLGFWAIGIMILSACGYGIRAWRYLILLTSGTGILYYLCWFIIPESPRWLATQKRFDEAQAILAKIAKNNKTKLPDTAVLNSFVDKDDAEKVEVKQYTYVDLFRNSLYCKRTIYTSFIRFTIYITYYGLTFNMRNLSGNRYLNMFFAGLLDQAGMLSVLFFTNSIGRRYSQCLGYGVALGCNIVIMAVFAAGQKERLADLILTGNLIGKSSAIMGLYVIGIWTAELFPTTLRTQAAGVGSVAGRIGVMLAPQMVYLSNIYDLSPYIITSILIVITAPLLFLLPETKGQKLDEGSAPSEHSEVPTSSNESPLKVEGREETVNGTCV